MVLAGVVFCIMGYTHCQDSRACCHMFLNSTTVEKIVGCVVGFTILDSPSVLCFCSGRIVKLITVGYSLIAS